MTQSPHQLAGHTTLLRAAFTLAALLAVACGPVTPSGTDAGSRTDGGTPAGTPTVTATVPADATTGTARDTTVSATFSRAMAPLTTATFTLQQGTTPVDATVATSADGLTATLSPTTLAADTQYTATITAAAKSLEGVALAQAHTWRFTTSAVVTVPTTPQVTATRPALGELSVPINARVIASFSLDMQATSFTTTTFTLTQGATLVPGTVTYGPGPTATFTPTAALPTSALLTATLTTGVKAANGNALAQAWSWTFTTGTTAALGPAPVSLGAAGNFVILAKTAISTVPPSVITGSVALGPAAASYLTGFSLVADATNVFATSPQVVGRLYAANYAAPTPSNLTTAVGNMEGAYTDAASRPTPDFLELSTGNLGGLTLVPGLYKWTSSLTVPADLTLSGGANDVWILQTTGDLSMSANKRVTLVGGALASNVFWQVAGKATLGAGAHLEGVLLCKTEITVQTGASVNGRLLAQSQVALQQATVTQPAAR
jgi:hypothetical protein